ncbi:hypothetical protein BGZ97_009268 [Linnemannia gamsii]|uniref:RRM domain-containing protein n=1 Tax=Linnemannia gamsii TaxID=64522 RepID=A0A9P6R843_9FUNG|nr:hypothetical protein BGZ97_009268 [Linnemannia gamsii]
MNQIDQSLDDLIKKQREQKKKMKGKTNQQKDTKIPKKTAGGLKSRTSFIGLTTGKKQQQEATGPLTTKSMRLVTTQQIKREGLTSATAAAAAAAARRDERIPTGPRIPETSAHTSASRGGDNRRPAPPSGGRQVDRNPTQHPGDLRGGNRTHQEPRSGNLNGRISIPNNHNSSNPINLTTNHSNNNSPANKNSNHANAINRQSGNPKAPEPVTRQDNRPAGRVPPATTSSSLSMDMDMEVDNGPIAIKGSAPGQQTVAFRGESGPVTIEIENLDPGTTTDDVKYVCSRFGEIRSCDCSNGFAQVTYARKAAGIAAIDNLNGKKADNNQILRVTMRAEAIFHDETPSNVNRVPSSIAGPMKILQKAVHGTLRNHGNLYSDNILAAERVLREQQQRMAQLHDEEQRMAMLRMQNAQLGAYMVGTFK